MFACCMQHLGIIGPASSKTITAGIVACRATAEKETQAGSSQQGQRDTTACRSAAGSCHNRRSLGQVQPRAGAQCSSWLHSRACCSKAWAAGSAPGTEQSGSRPFRAGAAHVKVNKLQALVGAWLLACTAPVNIGQPGHTARHAPAMLVEARNL
jgi:hypothetical protein